MLLKLNTQVEGTFWTSKGAPEITTAMLDPQITWWPPLGSLGAMSAFQATPTSLPQLPTNGSLLMLINLATEASCHLLVEIFKSHIPKNVALSAKKELDISEEDGASG